MGSVVTVVTASGLGMGSRALVFAGLHPQRREGLESHLSLPASMSAKLLRPPLPQFPHLHTLAVCPEGGLHSCRGQATSLAGSEGKWRGRRWPPVSLRPTSPRRKEAGGDLRSRRGAAVPAGTGGPGPGADSRLGPGVLPHSAPQPEARSLQPVARQNKSGGRARRTRAPQARPSPGRLPPPATHGRRAFGPSAPSALGSFRRGRRRWRGRGGGRAW